MRVCCPCCPLDCNLSLVADARLLMLSAVDCTLGFLSCQQPCFRGVFSYARQLASHCDSTNAGNEGRRGFADGVCAKIAELHDGCRWLLSAIEGLPAALPQHAALSTSHACLSDSLLHLKWRLQTWSKAHP